MAKKELRQIIFSWHKSTGVVQNWQDNEITYVADEDYVIVAIDAEIEAYATAAQTQVLGAQLSYASKHFEALMGTVADAARRRCLMSIATNSLIVTSGGTNFWRGKTLVFPEDCRPNLDEDDELNLHVFSSAVNKGGQITFTLHVYVK